MHSWGVQDLCLVWESPQTVRESTLQKPKKFAEGWGRGRWVLKARPALFVQRRAVNLPRHRLLQGILPVPLECFHMGARLRQ